MQTATIASDRVAKEIDESNLMYQNVNIGLRNQWGTFFEIIGISASVMKYRIRHFCSILLKIFTSYKLIPSWLQAVDFNFHRV